MWEGLPVPAFGRVEHNNGIDYYVSLDKHNFINIINSSMERDYIDIIIPIYLKSIGVTPIPLDYNLIFINEFRNWPLFDAKIESFINKMG
jgi:hypothetical protein